MQMVMTRAAIEAKLAEVLKLAEADDRRRKAEHEKEERAAHEVFRKMLRDALKWDYATTKKNRFEVELGYRDQPACPVASAPQIKLAIAMLKLDGRKSAFNVSDTSDLGKALLWLPENMRPAKSLCA